MSAVPKAGDHVMWAPILAFSCILMMLAILLSLPFLLTRMRRVPGCAWFLDNLSTCMGAPWPPVSDSAAPPRKPLSKALRHQLQVSHFKPRAADCEHAEDDCCPICFCDYSEGQAIITLRCKHYFHKECIWKWLKRDSTCPMCKMDLQPNSSVAPRNSDSGYTASGRAATASTAAVRSTTAAAAAAGQAEQAGVASPTLADVASQPAVGDAQQQAVVIIINQHSAAV